MRTFFEGIATLALAMTRKINRLCERSEAGSTARPPFVALTRATSPVSSGESTPGRVNYRALLSPIVILSASEISHDQSEEYMPRQFFGGIAALAARNDTESHPPGSLLRRFASLAKTNKKVRHIER